MANIISVEYEYTGGQTMSFWGELDNNNWYTVDQDGCISEYDTDTNKYMQRYFNDEDFDSYEFDMIHVLKRYHPTEKMLDKLIDLVESENAKTYLKNVKATQMDDYGKVLYEKQVF